MQTVELLVNDGSGQAGQTFLVDAIKQHTSSISHRPFAALRLPDKQGKGKAVRRIKRRFLS